MSQEVDFLIIGGGISGHLLKLELDERNATSILLDSKENNISTAVAAGIANPVTGKYLGLTWRADEFFPFLKRRYADLSERYDLNIFDEKPILRVFTSAGEQNIWIEKSSRERYKSFCKFERSSISGINNPWGHLEIMQGGDIQILPLLDKLRKDTTCIMETFTFDKLDIEKKIYSDIKFGKIIFCEGYSMIDNPFFCDFPLIPNKGQLLEIESPELNDEHIYSGGVFVQPLGSNRFRVGATYELGQVNTTPSEAKKEELVSRLEKFVKCEFTVVNHFAGIRPTTKDRRPILGSHENLEDVCVFNGMGSKGFSIVPLLAKEMADYLLNNTPLHPETNCKRFVQ